MIVGTVSFLLLLQTAERPGGLLSWQSAALAAATLLAFGILIPHERRAPEPVLAVHLLGNRVFVRTVMTSAVIGCAYFGSSVFFPLYFQIVGGHSAAESGLMLLPQLLAGTVMTLVAGQVVSRTGHYKPAILIGMTIVSLALFMLGCVSLLSLGDIPALVCLFLLGMGGPICMSNLMVSLQNAIDPRDLGVGTSSQQFCNALAAVAGVATSGMLLTQRVRSRALDLLPRDKVDQLLTRGISHLPPHEHLIVADIYRYAFGTIFITSAALTFVALIFATRIPVLSLRESVAVRGSAPDA